MLIAEWKLALNISIPGQNFKHFDIRPPVLLGQFQHWSRRDVGVKNEEEGYERDLRIGFGAPVEGIYRRGYTTKLLRR